MSPINKIFTAAHYELKVRLSNLDIEQGGLEVAVSRRSVRHPACRRVVASSPAEKPPVHRQRMNYPGTTGPTTVLSGRQDARPLRQAGCPTLH